MALLDTFRGLLANGEREKKHVIAGLRTLQQGFVDRAKRLELTAGQAPSDAAESDLRRLSVDHRATAELLGTALEARNSSAGRGGGEVVASDGSNHWARIVEDLGVLHKGRDEILEQARDLLDLDPGLIDLFDTLTLRMNDHIARLRGEIAEADPQALN